MRASQLRARYWRIVFFFGWVILGSLFWESLLPRVGLHRVVNRTRSARTRIVAVRFRTLAIDMGGLMIKVGQFLSARLDVLPSEITHELAGLQDEVPAEDFGVIRGLAEAELGRPLEHVFGWIDRTPMAAASLGQVHRARLRQADGAAQGFADVVIKVQRPCIDRIVEVDLSALRRVAVWLQRNRAIRARANVPALVEEFARTTLEELDYTAEGRNAELFGCNLKDDPRVHVPRVVWSLTSRRLLTLEDVSAIKLSDYKGISAAGIDRSQVASALVDTYMQQIFEDGFFHADPHPGNIFVTPVEGAGSGGSRDWKLTFVDFGMVGRVPDNLRAGLHETVIAVGTQDAARLVQSFRTLDVLLPTADLRQIELAGAQLFDRFWGMTMGELREIDHADIARFGSQFRDLLLDMPFQLPQNLLMLGRTVGILSGMCTGLDPAFNVWNSIAPFAAKLVTDEGVSNWKTWLTEAGKWFQVLIGLPGRTDRVLSILERGELNVRNPDLDRRMVRLERSVNRVAGGIFFAALLISGAILYPADPGLARILIGGAVLPLAWGMFGGRGHGW